MPSASQPGVRPEVCRRERRVRELVGDDAAAAVGVERRERGPDDEQPLRGDVHDALRGALLAHGGVGDRRQRRDAADAGGHPARLGGVARHDDEVAPAQRARGEHVAHPRVAVLERVGRPVTSSAARREDHEVAGCARAANGATSHGWRWRRLVSERIRQPRGVRTARSVRSASKRPRTPRMP